MLLLLLRFPLPQISSCAPLRAAEREHPPSDPRVQVRTYMCVTTTRERGMCARRKHDSSRARVCMCRREYTSSLPARQPRSLLHNSLCSRTSSAERLHGARATRDFLMACLSSFSKRNPRPAFQELAPHNFPTYAGYLTA